MSEKAETTQQQVFPSADMLLGALRQFASTKKLGLTHLFLVSLPPFSPEDVSKDMWVDYRKFMSVFADRQKGRLFQLAHTDTAVMLNVTEYSEVGTIADLRLGLLKLIREHFPESFATSDPSRLIRLIDLRTKLNSAILLVNRYVEAKDAPAEKKDEAPGLRKLKESDILKVEGYHATFGGQTFADRFIEWQPIAHYASGKWSPIFYEHYVGMGRLCKGPLEGVDLRGGGNLFNQLTLLLDRIFLDAFKHIASPRRRSSININVDTMFTRAFERFLEGGNGADMKNFVFELRQGDVLNNFEKFEIGARLITEKGATIAIDAIMPESLGVVNIQMLSSRLAKIFWNPEAEKILPKKKAYIKHMQDKGVTFVLSRVDDQQAVEIGLDVGINLFQGFHVDKQEGLEFKR